MKNKLIFLVQSWGDPHEMNRIKHYKEVFNNIDIYGFSRKGVHYNFGFSEYNNLGNLKDKSYIVRLGIYLKTILVLCKINKNNIFYIQGTDNLFLYNIACLITFRKPAFIYQISDIIDILTSKKKAYAVIRFLDFWFIKNAMLLIVTSDSFVKEFYQKQISNFKVGYKLIENKIHMYNNAAEIGYPLKKVAKNKDAITIGYFGFIRCKRSIEVLLELARKNNDFVIIIRGILSPDLEKYYEEFNKKQNIHFLGKYISPFHLKEMYGEIDLAWICYPFVESGRGNIQWARTNRYYEAGYFKIPMIAQKGTKDSLSVMKYGFGISLNLSNVENCVDELKKLSFADINKFKQNFDKINESAFVITNDYDSIDNFLKKQLSCQTNIEK